MPPPPFGNERQDRIYTQQYANYRRSYWHMERMHAELAEVYGYTATPRLRSNAEVTGCRRQSGAPNSSTARKDR